MGKKKIAYTYLKNQLFVMKMILKIVSICFALFVVSASATTYFVSPLGDNNNIGTSEFAPFRSVQYAIDKMETKDVLVVLDGHYLEELTIKSGITIKAKNPRKVLFSSLKEIPNNFILHSGKIYKIALGMDTKMLFYNGYPMNWARWPNASWEENNVENKKWAFATEGTGPGVLRSNDFQEISSLNIVGGYCNIRYGKGNSCYSRVIESFDGTTLHWNDDNFYEQKYTGEDGPVGSPEALLTLSDNSPYHPKNSRFFVTGSFELLDTQSEWFVKEDTLYFYAPDGKNPNNASVRYQTFDYCINEKGIITDFTIEGIDFSGCSIQLLNVNNKNIKIINSHFKYIDGSEVYVDRIAGREVEKPVFLSGNDISIERCLFFGAQNSALSVKGNKILVNNSVFLENNRNSIFESRPIIIFLTGSDGFSVTNNTLINNSSDCIYVIQNVSSGLVTPPTIAYNHIFNGAIYNTDVSGIYLPHKVQNYMEVHHNWVHNINGTGIRLDLAGTELSVHHNVLWGSKRGLSIEGYRNFNIYNNTSVLHDYKDDIIRNILEHYQGAPAKNDSTFPPIRDWNILNNLFSGMKDDIGPREIKIYKDRVAANLTLHEKRQVGRGIPLENIGDAQGNYTLGDNYEVFSNIEAANLNLLPIDHDSLKTAIVSQTSSLADEGVHFLSSFKGAYDINDNYWNPGSDWMPEGMPVLKTMADANNFAKDNKTISLMFKVRIPQASGTVGITSNYKSEYPVSIVQNNKLLSFNNLEKDTKIEILNINGKIIKTCLYNGLPISLDELAKGLYVVKVSEQLFVQKIIKR